jgi:hypothetical protein
MDDKVLQHIEDALQEVRVLFMKAAVRIEAIKPGEKIPATQLADDLAKERGMTGPQLYPSLKILVNDKYPGVIIRRGAHGGIYRPLPGAAVDKPTSDGDTGGQPQSGDTVGNTWCGASDSLSNNARAIKLRNNVSK